MNDIMKTNDVILNEMRWDEMGWDGYHIRWRRDEEDERWEYSKEQEQGILIYIYESKYIWISL